MSLPASSVPVAVLVLAWDETTPAVRALVEATETAEPTLDSVVVLVPAGPATAELTQEEFLPLEASLLPELALPPAPVPSTTQAEPEAEETENTPAPEEEYVVLATLPTTETPASVAPNIGATTDFTATSPLPDLTGELPLPRTVVPTSGLVGQETFAVPGGPAVRVLRLSEFSLAALAAYSQQVLPAPTWVGLAAVPATPYLGSLVEVLSALPLPSAPPTLAPATPEPTPAIDATLASVAPGSAAKATDPQRTTAAVAPVAPAPGYLTTEQPTALEAEADTTPVSMAAEPALIAEDVEKSTTELSEEAADELTESFAVDVSPVQASWADALSSLQKPASFEAEQPANNELVTNSLTEQEPAAYATLVAAARQFDAPDLNFQIIQYARFAVPLALAAQPFGIIYAPAWPTWLAAQELRQRTGRPLVLHITTLAAADEPLDLAAGWPAEIQRQALHRADLILTETPALAYRLRRELDLPAHRVRPVPAADAAAVAQALSTAQVW